MKKTNAAIAIGLIILGVTVLLLIFKPLQVIEWKISDLFFRSKPASDLITIIAIDDKSLSPEFGLGRFKDWPRSYYAQLLRTIAAQKPAVVAFDLDFREASRGMSDLRLKQLLRDYEKFYANAGSSAGYNWYSLLRKFETGPEANVDLTHPDDADFQKALIESGPVVLTSKVIISETPAVIAPIFSGPNVSHGHRNILLDRDGVLRRILPWQMESSERFLPSFAIAIAKAYLDRGVSPQDMAFVAPPEKNSAGEILINYTAKPFSYRMLSFVDVLAGKYEPSAISGKIVLVGATAPIIQDYILTPTSRQEMAGVEMHANVLQQILEMKSLRTEPAFLLYGFLLLLTLGGSFLFLRLTLRFVAILFAVILIAIPVAAFGLYQTGIVLSVAHTELAWIFTAIAALIYRNQTEFREKREIKRAFSHYVSPVVVNDLIKNPSMLRLGGKRQNLSVMFSDIVGFTTLAEKLSPEDTVALLNDYLTAMTEIIFSYNGTLDKYQGDAIMALFGAPLDDTHHAVNACSTALSMRKALSALHEKWNSIPQLPFKEELIQLDFRVGIASGPAVCGNVGSEKRFDYTAIGDIVNLGSRLESVNRKYGTHVLVDKETFVEVTENHNPFVFRKLDAVRVKGREQTTEIFEVVGFAESATSELKSMLDDFENGRILYTQRNFMEAKQYFESALKKFPSDGPSQIYRNRCNFFIRKPPGREWSAVVDMAEK